MDLKVFFLLGWLTICLPAEPPEQYLVKERYDVMGGFYFREYSVMNDGKINYMTMRRIIQILPEEDGVVYTDDLPLFYWFDWDGNGKFDADEMWTDPNEKGLDIRKYDYKDAALAY